MFYFRINRIGVSGVDSAGDDRLQGLLGSDVSQLRLLSFFTTDNMELPDVDAWRAAGTKKKKRKIEEGILEDFIGRRVIAPVTQVVDGRLLEFGTTGYLLHHARSIPGNLDLACVLLRTSRDIRGLGVRPAEFLDDPDFGDFFEKLSSIVRSTSGEQNQRYVVGAEGARFMASVISKNLGDDEGAVLGSFYLSLNREEHYPGGIRIGEKLRDLSGNIEFDYALFGIDPMRPEVLAEPPGSEPRDAAGVAPSPAVVIATGPQETELLPQPKERMERAALGGKRVFSHKGDNAFFFVSKLSIDADGSPRAYHPKKGKGLDYLANGGKPGNWWALATENGKSSGKPVVQSSSAPAPGYYVSMTALSDGRKSSKSPEAYVNAEEVPYFVLPGKSNTGAKPGDMGMVINLASRKAVGAIYADVGPRNKVGEASIAVAKALDVPGSAKSGGVSGNILYIVFPGSRANPRWPLSSAKIQSIAKGLFKAWGGMAQVNASYPNAAFIRSLQVALNRTGADLEEDGEWGPVTEGAIREFQDKQNLPVTGFVDAGTAKRLKTAAPTAKAVAVPTTGSSRDRLIARLVDLAQGEVGIMEVGGNNRGRDVVKYQKASWLDPAPWAWCAAFICWLYREGMRDVGVTSFKRPRTAGAFGFERWAREQGHEVITSERKLAKKGDLVVFDFSHIGIVISDQRSTSHDLKTVEGNTNGRGDRDSVSGDGVWKKKRANSLRRTLIRLRKTV